MSYFVLDLNSSSTFVEALEQIDESINQLSTGDPNGVKSAGKPGIFCFDTTNGVLYLATEADGTILGTTWVVQDFDIEEATNTVLGLIRIANLSETATGTDQEKAVTPYGAAQTYAKKGSNSDITQLTGLTTPLSEAQGGTAASSFLNALIANLPSDTSKANFTLTTDGADNLSWQTPLTGLPFHHTSNGSLVSGSVNSIGANSLTLNLPASPAVGERVGIIVGSSVTGIVIGRGGNKIESLTQDMSIDFDKISFELVYINSSVGWRVQ